MAIALSAATSASQAADGSGTWASAQANLTVFEYLDLFFHLNMHKQETTRKLDVHFIPGQSPETAVLYVVKPVVVPEADLPTRADLGQSIERESVSLKKKIARMLQRHEVASRWKGASVSANVIIRFVSSFEKTRTLAIVMDGKTFATAKEIESASQSARKRIGAVWDELARSAKPPVKEPDDGLN